MKKLSLTLTLTCIVFICFSQVPPWQWAKRGGGNNIGSNSGAVPFDLVTDSAGNIYMTGYCDGNYMVIEQDTFYNAASWGGSDEIFIVKYSAAGNLMWAKTYGGTDDELGYAITLDADGHLIAAGRFASTSVTFDTITLNNPSTGRNIYLVKFDENGNVIWGRTAIGNPYRVKVAADADNNIYLAATYTGTAVVGSDTLASAGGNDIFLAKYNSDASLLWDRHFGGTGGEDDCWELKVDKAGNVYIRGHYNSNPINFGGISLANTTNMLHGFVAKFDSSGTVVWANREVPNGGGSIGIWATGLAVDSYQNVYTFARFDCGNVTANGYMVYNTSGAGYQQIYLVKYDSSGNTVWMRQNSSGTGVNSGDIEVFADTSIYISGYFFCPSLKFGTTTLTNSNISGSHDVFLAKFNSGGSFRWAVNPYGHGNNFCMEMAVTATDEIYIAGHGHENMVFGSTTITDWFLPSDWPVYYFLAKMGYSTTNVDEVAPLTGSFVYPNPSSGKFMVSFGLKNATVEIFNMLGEKIYSETLHGESTAITLNCSSGMYFVKIRNEKKSITQKLIIE